MNPNLDSLYVTECGFFNQIPPYLICYFEGPLVNGDNFFIVAEAYETLYQVAASSGAIAQLLPFGGASNPVALAYDPRDKLLFWTDRNERTINRYSFLTNSSTEIYYDRSGRHAHNVRVLSIVVIVLAF